MALILCIETSSDICSVALSRNDRVISSISANEKNVHSSKLSLFIKEIFSQSGYQLDDLDAVAVSTGPGSFTGLRIGVALAKGICYGLNIPFIGINTLKLMTFPVLNPTLPGLLYCPLINARNGEHYYAVFNQELKEVFNAGVSVPDIGLFRNLAGNNPFLIFGDIPAGFEKGIAGMPDITVMQGIQTDAKNMISLAGKKYTEKDFEDISGFEPFYLKDFKAKKSSEKLKRILKG